MEQSPSYRAFLASPYRCMKHNTYFAVYDALFSRYRGQSVTFVEIGVLGGGSLFMWREFLGPQARIIGVDLNPNAKKWEAHGFEIFIGSQSDPTFWQAFFQRVGPVDVVLDDGGHTFRQQVITTEQVLEHIRSGGMLVVEDTHTSYQRGYGIRSRSFLQYVKHFLDRINSRFAPLVSSTTDRRVWSIQIFESIVAFHVDHAASTMNSAEVINGGIHDGAVDFRDHENSWLAGFRRLKPLVRVFRHLPGARALKLQLRTLVQELRGSAGIGRYF